MRVTLSEGRSRCWAGGGWTPQVGRLAEKMQGQLDSDATYDGTRMSLVLFCWRNSSRHCERWARSLLY